MLKIKGFICGLLLLAIQQVLGQELRVEGVSPNLYITHTVVAKENWYSVGRLYNLSPKQIAAANNTTLSSPLNVGQSLKIPLVTTNFSQNGFRAGDEVLVPVYYTVQEKEWMYRISVNHNKVPIGSLEKWNNVTNGQLHAGMKLIVGYLKVKSNQSALAAQAANGSPVAVNNGTRVSQEPRKEPATPAVTAETKKENLPSAGQTTPPQPETKTSLPENKPSSRPEVREEPKHTTDARTVSNTGRNGGYFHSLYAESGKGTAGNAGVFRSTSGWNDGKYYALMNNVAPGTIIRISFSSTNKNVYAKVLGPLPEMKESIGLTLRISDAAASELGASSGKFYVDVKY